MTRQPRASAWPRVKAVIAPTQVKPTIVFCHGIWADGSCFNKVIPALQADGHEVVAVQYSLESYEEDLAIVKRTLNRVGSPVLLVGHSYVVGTVTKIGNYPDFST